MTVPASPPGLVDGFWIALAAIISGAFGWIIKRDGRPPKKPPEFQAIETIQAAWGSVGAMLVDIQNDRAGLRKDVTELDCKLTAMERRLEDTMTKARSDGDRCERNMRRLHIHIEALCEMMRVAGLTPPADPTLEGDTQSV